MDNLQREFSKIYDKYIARIYRFIFIKVSSQEIAEDLCSETFLKGWEAFKKSSNPHMQKIDNPQAFLYKIARNLVVDYYREKGKTKTVSAEFVQIPDSHPDLEEKAAIGSECEEILRALSGIKDDYREIVVWHYLDDLRVPEIAKILDKPEGTVRVMLHRGLKALRTKINGGNIA